MRGAHRRARHRRRLAAGPLDGSGVDRGRDFAVVESPKGELCGFLSVEAEPPFAQVFALGIVAPAFHGLGLGAAIVSENERRARRFEALADPKARVLIHAGALADEPRVSALLSSRGYREVRRFELRRVDFAGEPPPPRDVEGISVRGLRPEEARQLYEAHVDAFADHWGEGEETYEDFRHRHLDAPEYDAGLWFAAWHGDELAGYVGAHEKSREDSSRGYTRCSACAARTGAGVSGSAAAPGLWSPLCARPAGSRPARRRGFAHRRDAAVREGRHDRPPSLCDLGERAPAHQRPLVHRLMRGGGVKRSSPGRGQGSPRVSLRPASRRRR